MAIYFLGFADILKKYLHCPARLSVVISVIINIFLLIAFFWFVGDRLSSQVSQLSDSLPSVGVSEFIRQFRKNNGSGQAFFFLGVWSAVRSLHHLHFRIIFYSRRCAV